MDDPHSQPTSDSLPANSALGLVIAEHPRPATISSANQLSQPLSLGGTLAVLVGALVIFNCLAAPMIRATGGGRDAALVIVPAIIGILMGQIGALACCLVFFPGPFVQRLLIHWTVTALLSIAFLLGLVAATVQTAGAMSQFWQHAVHPALCMFPIISLAAQLPLWPLRTYLGCAITQVGLQPTAENPRPLSIHDMLSGTAVVAFSFGLVRLAPQFDGPYWWVATATSLGTILVASLIIALPAVLFILRSADTSIGLGMLAGYTLFLLLAFFTVTSGLFSRSFPPAEVVIGLFIGFFAFNATLATPLLILRSFGYRLLLPRDRREATRPFFLGY